MARQSPPALWFYDLSPATDLDELRDRALVSGHGCFVRDAHGREYLDTRSALWNASLGYDNRRVIEAMRRQLDELPVAQIIRHNQPTRGALEYAERLVATLPGNLSHVRLCTTGAQAVEAAVMLSRFVRLRRGQPDRSEVVALWAGYHGISGLASALTGEPPLHDVQRPLAPGVHHVPPQDIDALREAIERIGAERVTAVVMEPVLGTDVVELTPQYLKQVQDLCRERGIHFVLDEVTTGFGRTGSMTVAGRLGLAPDMLVLSKGITSGYAPLSAVAVTGEILESAIAVPEAVFPHGSTGDGNPVAIAAASAVLDELAETGVLANVSARGDQLRSGVRALADDVPAIGGIHGPGLMLAVELVGAGGEPLSPSSMSQVKNACREEGLLVATSSHMVLLTPPLIISSDECDRLIDMLARGVRRALPATSAVGVT